MCHGLGHGQPQAEHEGERLNHRGLHLRLQHRVLNIKSYHLQRERVLLIFFQSDAFISFSCLISLATVSSTMFSRSRHGTPVFLEYRPCCNIC